MMSVCSIEQSRAVGVGLIARQKAQTDTAEALSYVSEMLAELAVIARYCDQRFLAYMIEIACIESREREKECL